MFKRNGFREPHLQYQLIDLVVYLAVFPTATNQRRKFLEILYYDCQLIGYRRKGSKVLGAPGRLERKVVFGPFWPLEVKITVEVD